MKKIGEFHNCCPKLNTFIAQHHPKFYTELKEYKITLLRSATVPQV